MILVPSSLREKMHKNHERAPSQTSRHYPLQNPPLRACALDSSVVSRQSRMGMIIDSRPQKGPRE